MNMNAKNNISGFSILEIVVSVSVIALILLSIALLSTKSLQIAQMAQTRQKAITYAREGIETIRYERDSKNWSDFITDLSRDEETLDSGFKRSYVFEYYDSNHDIIVKDDATQASVDCTVTWNDVKGEHTVSQTAILTKRP